MSSRVFPRGPLCPYCLRDACSWLAVWDAEQRVFGDERPPPGPDVCPIGEAGPLPPRSREYVRAMLRRDGPPTVDTLLAEAEALADGEPVALCPNRGPDGGWHAWAEDTPGSGFGPTRIAALQALIAELRLDQAFVDHVLQQAQQDEDTPTPPPNPPEP